MTKTLEKAISTLAGNLNLGRNYLITTVHAVIFPDEAAFNCDFKWNLAPLLEAGLLVNFYLLPSFLFLCLLDFVHLIFAVAGKP